MSREMSLDSMMKALEAHKGTLAKQIAALEKQAAPLMAEMARIDAILSGGKSGKSGKSGKKRGAPKGTQHGPDAATRTPRAQRISEPEEGDTDRAWTVERKRKKTTVLASHKGPGERGSKRRILVLTADLGSYTIIPPEAVAV